MKQNPSIRVRFAPSPTGTLHVGGARTALFNWLFARSCGGTFILRIEDTDQTRYDAAAEALLIEDLRWLGLNWDEGEDQGGNLGPYRQSKRLDLYHQHALQLIEKGKAYYCFCTSERLDEVRETQKAQKINMGYDRHCRDLSPEDVAENLKNNEPHVIRLKVPLEGRTVFTDHLRGKIEYNNSELDDLILVKTDKFPSYHLANVVDDHSMQISHVLRGEEWIPSTPKHVLIYQGFGWEPPSFVHLPVILAEGGGKLSKRKGAASVSDYKELGYLPQTMNNFLALLGWSPGEDQEILSMEALSSLFSLERINPKSCAFDGKKLEWMNGQYIMKTPVEELLPIVVPYIEEKLGPSVALDSEYVTKVVTLLQERVKRIPEFWENGFYFFNDPNEYEEKASKKHFNPEAVAILESIDEAASSMSSHSAQEWETRFRALGEAKQLGLGKLVHPVRLALCGISFGPGLFELMEVLGPEVVSRRLKRAVQYLQN